MKYKGNRREASLGKSGHIVDMMSAVLSSVGDTSGVGDISYCDRGIDYLERECQDCSLCNYERDCHNNKVVVD